MPNSAPQIAAIVWWARAVGNLRAATLSNAGADICELQVGREALRGQRNLLDRAGRRPAEVGTSLALCNWRRRRSGDQDHVGGGRRGGQPREAFAHAGAHRSGTRTIR